MNKNKWQELDERIISCRLCSRLVAWREEVARVKKRAYRDWGYWGNPVPGFGDENAKVLIVGLAPGAHGSNRTGRMFTGDASGIFLYRGLFKYGFANQAMATNREDGLRLKDIYITAVCRCVPPDNHPTQDEIQNCQPYLLEEIRLLKSLQGIVALGGVAYKRLQVIFDMVFSRRIREPFSHNNFIPSEGSSPWLLMSYHPSQQNTQTGRLTETMFDTIWSKAHNLIQDGER
jgi:uracil-DNA glycosylase family 4